MANFLITGASSVVGLYLLPLLEAHGHMATAISRRAGVSTKTVKWVCCDISKGELAGEVANAEILIHLAPLTLIMPLLESGSMRKLRRIICISTTSIFTKSDSNSAYERRLMASLQQAEEKLMWYQQSPRIRWTLFRPTLVYDGIHDKNIAMIGRIIRRFHFFPVINPASGLRQPLHAADLAWACIAVLDKPITEFKSYNLTGGELLSYREIVCRIFQSFGLHPRLIPVPQWLYSNLLFLASLHPRFRYLNAEIAGRMNKDMVFDNAQARNDFGFAPRGFNMDLPLD